MTDGLNQRYHQLWPNSSDEEFYIMELQEKCSLLEQRLLDEGEKLPAEIGYLIESYIYHRSELELYSITQAFKAGQKANR